jgi:hypothetical protein
VIGVLKKVLQAKDGEKLFSTLLQSDKNFSRVENLTLNMISFQLVWILFLQRL